MTSMPQQIPIDTINKKPGPEVDHLDDAASKHVFESGFSAAEEKKILRRIDFRLLPILGIMYSISLVDRTNLGLALVAGMAEDLELTVGNRYTILVMIFFLAYMLFEIPSNLVLPRAGAANWLTFLGISFGSILIGMGFTKSWGTMALCRALLGMTEAGFLPGCTYLITCWYKLYEVGKRLSAFWILSCITTGFAAIFAYVLSLLKGTAGLNGWSWIFIIEGIITVVVCACGWFIIIDFPTKADNFLTPEEKAFVIGRINEDRGDAEEDPITLSVILHHLKDWKLYVWAFNLTVSTLPGYAYSYFLPVILKNGMGFSSTQSQLLSAPPYILAAIIAYTSGWLGDRFHIRGPIIAVHQLLTASGMLITVFAKGNATRYFGAFLANNITRRSKRAVATAICLIGGGLGGIVSGVAFKSSESPRYETGIWTTLAFSIVSVGLISIMSLHFYRCNSAARAGKRRNEGMAEWYYTY
ncbi:hypothetical protein RBB50_007982 [Rhinocladiella similis]